MSCTDEELFEMLLVSRFNAPILEICIRDPEARIRYELEPMYRIGKDNIIRLRRPSSIKEIPPNEFFEECNMAAMSIMAILSLLFENAPKTASSDIEGYGFRHVLNKLQIRGINYICQFFDEIKMAYIDGQFMFLYMPGLTRDSMLESIINM